MLDNSGSKKPNGSTVISTDTNNHLILQPIHDNETSVLVNKHDDMMLLLRFLSVVAVIVIFFIFLVLFTNMLIK